MAGSSRFFGIVSDVSGLSAGCIVNNISHTEQTQTAQARNEKGKPIDIAVVSTGDEISIDGLTTGSGVKAGSVITVGGKNYLVTGTSKTENNVSFVTQSVTARYAPDCQLWTLTSAGVICAPSATINSDTVPNSTP